MSFYRHYVDRLGRLADRRMDAITRTDARRAFTRLTAEGGEAAANGMARVCRSVWNDVLRDRDLPEGNVWARAIRQHEVRARDWAMSDDELRAFWAAVDGLKSPVRAAAWETLALTGLRRNEVLALRHEDVDHDAGTAWVARPKGGEDRAFLRPLASRTLETVEALRPTAEAMSSPHVFPAASRSGRVATLKSSDAEGLVPPHALRHTWASRALEAGVPMEVVSLALNHADGRSTTWKYVTRERVLGPVREATEAVASHLLALRDG